MSFLQNQVIGRRVQTNHLEYIPGPAMSCICFNCSSFTPRYECEIRDGIQDPTIRDATCCGGMCTSQPICAAPSPFSCNIGKSSKNENPLINVAWDGTPPNIKCIYDLDKIDTVEQVKNFTNLFGINNDVLGKMCFQPVTKCANDLTECSRIKSLEEGSDSCRLWFESLPPQTQDAYMESYCVRHNTKDCDCVLRSNKESYNLLKGMHSYNDGCWFLPCSDNLKYFVPSDLRKPNCPTNICQVIIDVANAEHVNIDDIKNDIVCNFGPQPPPPDSLWDMLIKTLKKYKYQIITITVIVITITTVAIVINSKK